MWKSVGTHCGVLVSVSTGVVEDLYALSTLSREIEISPFHPQLFHGKTSGNVEKRGREGKFLFWIPSLFLLFSVVDIGGDCLYRLGEGGVLGDAGFYLFDGMHHRGVVAVAEFFSDVLVGVVAQTPDQVHGDLAAAYRVPVPLLAADDLLVDTVDLADLRNNVVHGGDVLVLLAQHILDGFVYVCCVHVLFQEVLVGLDLFYRALQLPDVGCDILRDIVDDVPVNDKSQLRRFILHDGDAGLQVRGLYVHQKAPLKPGTEPVVQAAHLLGRSVAGEDDLAVGLVEGVEGVEKLVLCLLLARHELNVVHQQQVRLPVLHAEVLALAAADGVHKLVDEIVALDIDDAGIRLFFHDLMGNGVDEVGLSQTAVTVNEQGVVVLCRLGGHRLGGGKGQLIGGTHHKVLKGKFPALEHGSRSLGRVPCPVGAESLVVEYADGKIHRKDVFQGGGYIFQKAILDGTPLKLVAAVEDQRITVYGHGLCLVEPGVDGGLIELGFHLLQDHLPDILYRIQWAGSFLSPCVEAGKIDKNTTLILSKNPKEINTKYTYSKYKVLQFSTTVISSHCAA